MDQQRPSVVGWILACLVLLGSQGWAKSSGQLFIQAFDGPRPVEGLAVRLFDQEQKTDLSGSLLIEKLPEGSLSVYFPQSEQTVEVKIVNDQETFLKIELLSATDSKRKLLTQVENPISIASEAVGESRLKIPQRPQNIDSVGEILVLAPQSRVSLSALLEVRKKSSGVAEVLGSEQMSRQGDSDAASSLRRVTGLTLKDGKYVFVRGLGDRYSSVQLNGFNLPSPEPSRKVVPLDLFPTQILDQVLVQKSYNSRFNGEFGGGLIQLETKSKPQANLTQVGIGMSSSSFDDVLTYQGGKTDVWGVDDGTRQIPTSIRQALNSGKKIIESSDPTLGYTKEELRTLGASFRKNYGVFEKSMQPNPNLNLGVSLKGEQEKLQWGLSTSLSSVSSLDVVEKKVSQVDVPRPGELTLSETGSVDEYEVDRKLSLIVDTNVSYAKEHNLRLTLLGVRHSTDETSVKESSGPGVNDFSRRRTRTEWTERHLEVQQLQSLHQLTSDVELKLMLGRAQIRRENPDQKEVNYRRRTENDVYQLDPEVSGNLRSFSGLSEESQDLAMQFKIQKTNWKVALGAGTNLRERKSDTYRFQYIKDYLAGSEPDLTLDPDTIFNQSENWILVNQTGSADSYTGNHRVQHAFIDSQTQLTENLELAAGLRAEDSKQKVQTYFYFDTNQAQSLGESRGTDLLPSYSLVWKPSEAWRVRLAYGETLARPDFRELSTVRYIDEETGYEAKGNPQLKPAVIQNLDQRVEYYFEADEYLSLGAFYKKFLNPIEDVFQPVAGSLLKVPMNARAAENRGVELESRVSFRRLSRELRRWSLISNLSFIDSQIQLDQSATSQLTSSKRPLQGQSPFIINLGLYYDRPAQGLQGGLLYNVMGRRITEVGTDQRPDIYEEPYHQLDLVMSQKISKGPSLSFKIKNLLDRDVQSKQGGLVIRSHKKGTDYSMGATWTL